MGCFSLNGKTSLAFLHEIQNAEGYQLMLEVNPLPYTPLIAGLNYVFQKYNAAIFSSECTKESIER